MGFNPVHSIHFIRRLGYQYYPTISCLLSLTASASRFSEIDRSLIGDLVRNVLASGLLEHATGLVGLYDMLVLDYYITSSVKAACMCTYDLLIGGAHLGWVLTGLLLEHIEAWVLLA